MIYLYLKTHNQTGYKYLGKTIKDPFSYPGSGIDWVPHLEKHGNDVTTEVLFSTESADELRSVAIGYSKKFDVVNSKDFANRTIEEGQGGAVNTGKISITDGVTSRYIYPDEPMPEGWDKGRATKGKIAITDGVTTRRHDPSQPIPDGWYRGRATKGKSLGKGRSKPLGKCEYCGKVAAAQGITRYHKNGRCLSTK